MLSPRISRLKTFLFNQAFTEHCSELSLVPLKLRPYGTKFDYYYFIIIYLWSLSHPPSICLMCLSGILSQLSLASLCPSVYSSKDMISILLVIQIINQFSPFPFLSQRNNLLCKLFILMILLPWIVYPILKPNLKQMILLVHKSQDLFLFHNHVYLSLTSFCTSTNLFCSIEHYSLHKFPVEMGKLVDNLNNKENQDHINIRVFLTFFFNHCIRQICKFLKCFIILNFPNLLTRYESSTLQFHSLILTPSSLSLSIYALAHSSPGTCLFVCWCLTALSVHIGYIVP